MTRLTKVENYNALDIISAIALQDCGATADCLLRAWERANQHKVARPGVSSRILLDFAIGYRRERLPISGDVGALLASCTEISSQHARKVMEDAVALTYRMGHNFVCDGGFDAEAILAVHLVEHLDRLGYDEGLVLRAIAVEDVWDLLGTGDISAEGAWESARKDRPTEAEQRVEMARAEGFNAAMDGLEVTDETMSEHGKVNTSYAWFGVLTGGIKDLSGQAHGHDMAGEDSEMYETKMEDLKQRVADMSMVTDEEVVEFEQMMASP